MAVTKQYGSSVWLAGGGAYLDRAAAFVFPLLVLKWLGRADAYISIEFVISLSIILATFFDAGLRSYLLFDAKERGSAAATLLSTARAFKPLLWLHVLGVLLALATSNQGGNTEAYLVGLSIARASALSVTGLIMQGLILVGRPALGPLASISSWGLSGISLAWPATASDLVLTTVFFSGSLAILLGAACLTAIPVRAGDETRSATDHLRHSLRWGWPLLLSAAASMMVGNFSKLYAFSNLQTQEVLAFTFWMRAYSIVQLSHVAIVSVLMGEIYKAENRGILPDNLFRYLRLIAPPAFIIAALGLFGGAWIPTVPFLVTSAAAVLFVYFCAWCLGAYLEIYLTRNAQNSVILKASLASSAIYVLGILFAKPDSALHLSALMAVSATLYTGLIIQALRKKR